MEEFLVGCVEESLAQYLYPNASFIAERLYAEYPHEVSTNILFLNVRIIIIIQCGCSRPNAMCHIVHQNKERYAS